MYAPSGTFTSAGHATPPDAVNRNTPYTLDDGDPGGIPKNSGFWV